MFLETFRTASSSSVQYRILSSQQSDRNRICSISRFKEDTSLDYFDLSAVEVERSVKGESYMQFISEKSLSVGLYELKAGEQDPQTPHDEDEVYYVVRGRATMRVGTEKQDFKRGSIIYVRAGFEHKFNDIKEDLELLVFFAPAHKPF